jgi:hypothetical protein
MRKSPIIAALFLLLAGELVLARPGAALERRVNARQLVRTVDLALAEVTQAAGQARGLDPKDPRSAPFWRALNDMRLRIARLVIALERRDGEFFTLLDQGGSDLGALRVAWARAGVKNQKAGEGLRIASSSYRMLRANYGREGLRLRQGGGLSEAEQRHFQRIQRAQRRFAESLGPLREGSQRRGDRVTVAELDRFRAEAERIASARLDLEAYLNSVIASGEIRGEWEADEPYIRQDAPEDFVVANEIVEDLYADSDIGHVFSVDLGDADTLSHLDDETVVSRAEPGAVQVYQMGDGQIEDDPFEEGGEAEAPADGFVLEESAEPIDPMEVDPTEEIETSPAEDLPAPEPVVEGTVEEEDLEIEPVEPIEPTEDIPAVPPPGEAAPKLQTGPAAEPPPAATQPVPPPIG